MAVVVAPQLLSVIIPTRNRAPLLRGSLESLVGQTLSKRQFEVVIVDDGSADETSALCRSFAKRLPLRYFRVKQSGISAAKNLGVFAALGSIVLFFDDDDIAHPELCREHLECHLALPASTAVLGYTTWASDLDVTPVMDYVMNHGQFLFSYRSLHDRQMLDFSYFWGGRTSCKRLLLVKHGVFNQHFGRIIEDIELGYRLSRFGLKVMFNRQAIQYMNRPVGYADFCRRCEVEGGSRWLFSRLHRDATVQEYCQVTAIDARWAEMHQMLPAKVRQVEELERAWYRTRRPSSQNAIQQELYQLYGWTFNAFKVKGMLETRDGSVTVGDSRVKGAPRPARPHVASKGSRLARPLAPPRGRRPDNVIAQEREVR